MTLSSCSPVISNTLCWFNNASFLWNSSQLKDTIFHNDFWIILTRNDKGIYEFTFSYRRFRDPKRSSFARKPQLPTAVLCIPIPDLPFFWEEERTGFSSAFVFRFQNDVRRLLLTISPRTRIRLIDKSYPCKFLCKNCRSILSATSQCMSE